MSNDLRPEDDLRFTGSAEASQSFTITDPVALIKEHEKEWLKLGQEITGDGYQPWERFGVFIHELMNESTMGVDIHVKHIAPGWDDFECDFRWTEEMAARLDDALPKHLRSDFDYNAEQELESTDFEPGPDDVPLPGLEP